MKKLLTLCLLNLVSLALCSTTNVSDDSRKTSIRSASASVGSSAHLNTLNSLQSSQDISGKQQSTQQSNTGHTTYTRVQTPEYTSITQPQNAVYTQPTAPSGAGGYFISVNPQNVPTAALGPGPTPVMLQYLPHNPQQGPIQYLQLIPTRPLIVPISPYLPPNFNNPYTSSSTAQASSNSPYTLPHHSFSSSPQPSSTYGSSSYGSGSFGSNYSPSLQNPIGGYSTNYLTYSIRPNHGMQLVNGPIDLSLNTNEYIPMQQNDNSYKMRRV